MNPAERVSQTISRQVHAAEWNQAMLLDSDVKYLAETL